MTQYVPRHGQRENGLLKLKFSQNGLLKLRILQNRSYKCDFRDDESIDARLGVTTKMKNCKTFEQAKRSGFL